MTKLYIVDPHNDAVSFEDEGSAADALNDYLWPIKHGVATWDRDGTSCILLTFEDGKWSGPIDVTDDLIELYDETSGQADARRETEYWDAKVAHA